MIEQVLFWSGLAVGLVGLAVAVWAVLVRGRARGMGRGRLRCGRCWYDMSGAVADAAGARLCPECGRVAAHEKHLLKTRRYWRCALLGLFVMGVGIGTGAWPMVAATHWQRHAPSSVLVLLADAGNPTRADETWKELAARARYDQLARWQRGVLAAKLGKGLADLPTATADEHVDLICLLRPPPSRSLAMELVEHGRFIAYQTDEAARRARKYGSWGLDRSFRQPTYELEWKLHRFARVNEAISYAGTEIGRDALIRLLEREDAWKRDVGAAVGLARIGDERSITALCAYLAQEPIWLEAYLAVASIGPRARASAEPVLQGLIDSAHEKRRGEIRDCLAVLRGEVGDVTIALINNIMRDPPEEFLSSRLDLVLYAVRNDRFFEPGSPGHPERAVPVLIEYLGSETVNIRNTACELLQVIGPKARPALSHLKALLNDPDVATKAQLAIDAIRRPD